MTTKGVILEQADRSFTHIEPHGGGANAAIKAETAARKRFGRSPVPGCTACWAWPVSFGLVHHHGAIDAAIYTAEGDYVEAGIAAASMIPGGKGGHHRWQGRQTRSWYGKGAGTVSRLGKRCA
jgi:filamentous hemagglutinin